MEIELNGNKLNLTDEQVKEIVDKYGETNKTNKRWKPEYGEGYWRVSDFGDAEHEYWDDSDIDNWIYAQGNCFKTSEEADKQLEYLNAVATLKNSSDFVPDMNNDNGYYTVCYDRGHKKFSTLLHYNLMIDYIVYYDTYEEAEESIKKYRKEWNIVFGIED